MARDNLAKTMNKRRDIRRLAMQVLYQIDLTGVTDRAELLDSLDEEHDSPEMRQQATDLALAAWTDHHAADSAVSELTPDWPTHRQPPVDRAILRLAYHEIVSHHAPTKVAINEAVQLSKQYAAENSPAFINAVLDKLAKKRGLEVQPPMPVDESATQAPSQHPDVWLADAMEGDSG